MELNTYTIIYLLSNFFSIFIIKRFAEGFFIKGSNNKILSIIAYAFYFLITSAAYFILDIPIIALAINWITILCIFLTYESSFQKKIIYTTYIIAFMLCPELVVGALTGYFHFSFFSDGNYSSELGLIASKIIMYMEALLFRNFRTKHISHSVSIGHWLSTIIIPLTTLIYECMFVSNDNVTKGKMIASVIMLFVVNAVTFYLYDSLSKSYVQRSKLSILKTENTLYSKQCEIMHTATEELQSFRHDLNNQFIALIQLLNSKEYEKAEKQLEKLLSQTQSKIIYSTSGNVVVDGLINYKLQNAVNDGIDVKTEIAIPVNLKVDTSDIVTIIGNLLDNSLTALKNIPKGERNLLLKIVFSKERLIIRVANPFTGQIKYKDNKIISSKTNDGKHGYGLNNIYKAIEKYNGYMEIDHANQLFTVDIIIYVNSVAD